MSACSLERPSAYGTDTAMHNAISEAGADATLKAWLIDPASRRAVDDKDVRKYLDDEGNKAGIALMISDVFSSLRGVFPSSIKLILMYLGECKQSHHWPVLALLIQHAPTGVGYKLFQTWQRAVIKMLERFPQWNHLSLASCGADKHLPAKGLKTTPVALAAEKRHTVLLPYLVSKVTGCDEDVYRSLDDEYSFADLFTRVAFALLPNLTQGLDHRDDRMRLLQSWAKYSEKRGWEVVDKFNMAPGDYRYELRYRALIHTGHCDIRVFKWLDKYTRFHLFHKQDSCGMRAAENFWIPYQEGGLETVRTNPIWEVPERHLIAVVRHLVDVDVPVHVLFEHRNNERDAMIPVAWNALETTKISQMKDAWLPCTVFSAFLNAVAERGDHACVSFSKEDWGSLLGRIFALPLPYVSKTVEASAGSRPNLFDAVVRHLLVITNREVINKRIFPAIPDRVVKKLKDDTREAVVLRVTTPRAGSRRGLRMSDISAIWLRGLDLTTTTTVSDEATEDDVITFSDEDY